MARITWVVLAGAASMAVACASNEASEPGDNYDGTLAPGTGSGDGSGDGSGSGSTTGIEATTLATGCAPYGSDVYTPYTSFGPVSAGDVTALPWRGPSVTYPDSVEDFRAYSLPSTVECGSDKDARDYLDVTAGCLSAVSSGGGKVGQTHGTTDGYYRSVALPYDGAHQRQVAWHDVGVEYRFNYSQWTGDVSNPGFKAFARYLTEYDLYVASWRMDGVVQIQKKQCGVYTILKRDASYGAPSPNTWHTIRFEVVGDEQRLYLDGHLAMTTTDAAITHGTAGIRIDSAEGALIDDWHVFAP